LQDTGGAASATRHVRKSVALAQKVVVRLSASLRPNRSYRLAPSPDRAAGMPRLKAIHVQKLSRPDVGQPDAYPNLQAILTKPIDWELVRQQCDQIVKCVTAVRLGTAETESIRRRVGARIDRWLCFSLSACVSADPGGDRHAETCHPVEHVAPDFCFGPLIG
jgi:hypothetical protein